jgi:purine-binding chemotaxis protein CheW
VAPLGRSTHTKEVSEAMTNTDTAVKTERQLVIFALAAEAYGVDIGTVREIIRMQDITHVPNTPDFVEGVINLRGNVIPVVDLRKRFGVAVGEQTKDSRIVVVDIRGEDIGLMVDAVTEVMRLTGDAIEPASDLITTEDSYYISGIAKLGDELLILLDLDKVLSKEDRRALLQAKDTASAKAGVA